MKIISRCGTVFSICKTDGQIKKLNRNAMSFNTLFSVFLHIGISFEKKFHGNK